MTPDKNRLTTEKWITERNTTCEIILNYCVFIKPSPWGDRYIYYKLAIGANTDFNLLINQHRYYYLPSSYLVLPAGLSWIIYQTFQNGNRIQIISHDRHYHPA